MSQPYAGPVVAKIGELAITSTTVYTPAGEIRLQGSTWQVHDQWLARPKTPTWAIVAAIVGLCFTAGFSLLLLFVRETRHTGVVQVTVTNGAQQYVCRISVADQPQVQQIHHQVNYVRSLAVL